MGWFVLAMWLGGILLMGDGHGTAGLLWFFPLPMAYIAAQLPAGLPIPGLGSARLVRYLDEIAATFPTRTRSPLPSSPAAAPPPPARRRR